MRPTRPLRIGTRGSTLALWQARTVARLIVESGAPAPDIVVIRTSGDERTADAPPTPTASEHSTGLAIKRMFVKEIEEALLDKRIDLAVHSSKDLPAVLPDGLRIAAALPREDPRDALVLRAGTPAHGWEEVRAELDGGAIIGTSSVRRTAALRSVFPAATFQPIRGNVDTRLRKLDAGDCAALVLAAAGITRLGLGSRISALIPIDVSIPAPGQGIIAIEIAEDAAPDVRDAVARLDDPDASDALNAERAVVHALGGGCQLPLGVLARIDGQAIEVSGFVSSLDASRVVRASVRGNRSGAAAAGEELAARLLADGARAILDAVVREASPATSPSHTK